MIDPTSARPCSRHASHAAPAASPAAAIAAASARRLVPPTAWLRCQAT